jgi:TolB-like protein/class 3 adenylate cyclase/Tfp pilus assembly protein PilF
LTTERVERRLAAVLAADVAGYSRLMGSDEEGTLARLKAVRKALVDPAIATHRGRIVKTTGDGMLVEFASAVDAVRSAVEVQRGMAEENSSVPQNQRIEFRIGIHVGDIIIDDNDIFGDGVNVAARLEGIAEAGGVCMSNDAYRQVRGKVEIVCDDMGPQPLKNIAEPMQAWRVRLTGQAHPPGQSEHPTASDPRALPLPDKPSIAVLPFQNMGGDPEQEYFADGIVEDIITALSRVKWFFVIARNSSFTYKGRAVDIRQVGRELGVRYVLEGSIRRSGNRVRITGQLIEAATGNHVWADKFEGSLEDVFELQDRITETVVGAIEPSLTIAEIRRSRFKPTASLDAYDLYLRALSLHYTQTRESLDEALRLLDKAIALDPHYAFAKAYAAFIYAIQHTQTWSTPEGVSKGGRLAHEALLLSQDEPTTIAFAAHPLAMLTRDYDAALAAMDRAVYLNPNSAQILVRSAHMRTWVSDADRAIDEFSRSMRLSPADPEIGYTFGGFAWAFMIKGDYEKALEYARRSSREMPRWAGAWRAVVVASVKTGRLQEAQEAVRRVLLLSPHLSISELHRRYMFRDEWVREMFYDAYRKAGLPE